MSRTDVILKGQTDRHAGNQGYNNRSAGHRPVELNRNTLPPITVNTVSLKHFHTI